MYHGRSKQKHTLSIRKPPQSSAYFENPKTPASYRFVPTTPPLEGPTGGSLGHLINKQKGVSSGTIRRSPHHNLRVVFLVFRTWSQRSPNDGFPWGRVRYIYLHDSRTSWWKLTTKIIKKLRDLREIPVKFQKNIFDFSRHFFDIAFFWPGIITNI